MYLHTFINEQTKHALNPRKSLGTVYNDMLLQRLMLKILIIYNVHKFH